MAGKVVGRVAVGIVCFWGFALITLFFFYSVSPWTDPNEIPFFHSRLLDSALFGMAGLTSLFVIARLIQGRRWAWWTAFVVSIFTLGWGVFFFYSSLHPQTDFARSESGFGLGVSMILMTPSAMCTVLLALPCVRRRLTPS